MLILFKLLLLLFLPSLLLAHVLVNNKLELVKDNDIHSCEALSDQYLQENSAKEKVSTGLNPDNISLLNWNIFKGNNDNWKQDFSSFAQTHDLMTIQEALLNTQFTEVLNKNKLNWIMNPAFYINGNTAGVMTTAKTPAINSCGFKTKEPIIQIPKSTLLTYYTINTTDKKLLVANIHSINFTLGMETYKNQLEELYYAIKPHNGPLIVAGDFNSWSSERMTELNRLIDKLSLSKLNYPNNTKSLVFGKAIDHVFYRDLKPISNRVIQVSSSDHMPISVNFQYSPGIIQSESDSHAY